MENKLEKVLEWMWDLDVKVVSVWIFSTENFDRDLDQVSTIMKMAEEKKGGVQELNKSENNSSGPAATKTTFTNTVCQCVTPAPKFDENHTCASCNKPVPKEKCSICKVKKE